MTEEYKTSENMQKFFDNLLEIKNFVLQKYDETGDAILLEIYEKLNKTIKTTKESNE